MIIKKVKIINENYPEYVELKPRIGEEYWIFNKIINNQFHDEIYKGLPHVDISIHCNYTKWHIPLISLNNCKEAKITKDEMVYIKSIEDKFNELTEKINNIQGDISDEFKEKDIYFQVERYENFFHEKAMEYFWGNEGYKSTNSYTVNCKQEYYNLESQRLDLIKCFIKGNWV